LDDDDDDFAATQSLCKWTKGKVDPKSDDRVNIWSLNGFGEPVFTGGMYSHDESTILEQTVKDYCASKNVTLSQLCGGDDYTRHNKTVRNAWCEIAQCLPHRPIISVYRRSLRQENGYTRGAWSEEEVVSLFNLVDLHGHRWAIIQNKLGRSATDCRLKFLSSNENFKRGKWSMEEVELLLKKVRSALRLPRKDMDVREINQWTLEQNSKIPWTAISCKVSRKRTDCYYKWKQMTKRSNQKAIMLGLEPIPMARDSHKFDVKSEYYQWKAEQDPKFRQKYAEEFIMPLLQKEGDGADAQKEHIQLLDSIIKSRAIRPSEISWHTFRGEAPRERWDDLVDKYAPDDQMDLPIWKLAKVVRAAAGRDVSSNKEAQDNQLEADPQNPGDEKKKKRKRKKQSSEPRISGVSIQQLQKAIKEIVDDSNLDITVKRVRKLLQEKLEIDLSSHKDMVKKMIKEVL